MRSSPGGEDDSEEGLRTTREALSEHLYSVVRDMVPHVADKVTGMLLECPTQTITELLADRKLLTSRVHDAITALKQSGEDIPATMSEEKQKLGDELFEKVAEIESELCAQITGMLLEMEPAGVQALLQDPVHLESAVAVARTEYLREHHPGLLPTREEFGDEIFETVSASYPEHASKITGMLLELDMAELQRLADQPDLMKVKIEQAASVIKSSSDKT